MSWATVAKLLVLAAGLRILWLAGQEDDDTTDAEGLPSFAVPYAPAFLHPRHAAHR